MINRAIGFLLRLLLVLQALDLES